MTIRAHMTGFQSSSAGSLARPIDKIIIPARHPRPMKNQASRNICQAGKEISQVTSFKINSTASSPLGAIDKVQLISPFLKLKRKGRFVKFDRSFYVTIINTWKIKRKKLHWRNWQI